MIEMTGMSACMAASLAVVGVLASMAPVGSPEPARGRRRSSRVEPPTVRSGVNEAPAPSHGMAMGGGAGTGLLAGFTSGF